MSETTACRKYGRQSTAWPATRSQMLPSHGSVSLENTRMNPNASTSAGSAIGRRYSPRATARTAGFWARKTA